MRAVEVGEVEHTNATIIGALDERFEFRFPQPRMIGRAVHAAHPGAEAKTTHLEFGLAERDSRVRIKIDGLRFRGVCKLRAGEYPADTKG